MSRTRPVIVDFDGVLNDVSARYYQVHRGLVAGGRLDAGGYWAMKRRRASLAELLEADGADPGIGPSYRDAWLTTIEAEEFLPDDGPIAGSTAALGMLVGRRPLVLATLRRRPEALHAQLDRRGLHGLFDEVLVGDPTGGWRSKFGLLSGSRTARDAAWIVGDTEVDIRAGRASGLKTAAVLTGIRDRDALGAESADVIVEDLRAFVDMLEAPTR